MDLKEIVLNKLTALKACEEGIDLTTKSNSTEELLDLYTVNTEFCFENDFPDTNLLLEYCDKTLLNKKQIFINEQIEGNYNGKIFLLGKSTAEIKCDKYNVSQIFVRHQAECHITGSDNSIIYIHLFNNSKCNITSTDNSNITIYQNDNSEIETQLITGKGTIKIIKK